jgi:hypothetical protein
MKSKEMAPRIPPLDGFQSAYATQKRRDVYGRSSPAVNSILLQGSILPQMIFASCFVNLDSDLPSLVRARTVPIRVASPLGDEEGCLKLKTATISTSAIVAWSPSDPELYCSSSSLYYWTCDFASEVIRHPLAGNFKVERCQGSCCAVLQAA